MFLLANPDSESNTLPNLPNKSGLIWINLTMYTLRDVQEELEDNLGSSYEGYGIFSYLGQAAITNKLKIIEIMLQTEVNPEENIRIKNWQPKNSVYIMVDSKISDENFFALLHRFGIKLSAIGHSATQTSLTVKYLDDSGDSSFKPTMKPYIERLSKSLAKNKDCTEVQIWGDAEVVKLNISCRAEQLLEPFIGIAQYDLLLKQITSLDQLMVLKQIIDNYQNLFDLSKFIGPATIKNSFYFTSEYENSKLGLTCEFAKLKDGFTAEQSLSKCQTMGSIYLESNGMASEYTI